MSRSEGSNSRRCPSDEGRRAERASPSSLLDVYSHALDGVDRVAALVPDVGDAERLRVAGNVSRAHAQLVVPWFVGGPLVRPGGPAVLRELRLQPRVSPLPASV